MQREEQLKYASQGVGVAAESPRCRSGSARLCRLHMGKWGGVCAAPLTAADLAFLLSRIDRLI
jgi:hypothetical protein